MCFFHLPNKNIFNSVSTAIIDMSIDENVDLLNSSCAMNISIVNKADETSELMNNTFDINTTPKPEGNEFFSKYCVCVILSAFIEIIMYIASWKRKK